MEEKNEKRKRPHFTLKNPIGCAYFGVGYYKEEDEEVEKLFEDGDIVEEDDELDELEELDEIEEEFDE